MASLRVRACAVWVLAALAVLPGAGAATARPQTVEGEGFEMLSTVPLDWALDAETTEVRGRAIALGAAVTFNGHPGGLLVADVENPAAPRVRAWLECASGSVVNIVRTWRPKVFAVFAAPSGGARCLGLSSYGFSLVDVSRPRQRRVLSSTPQFESEGTDLGGRHIGSFAAVTAVGHPTAPFVYSTRIVGEEGEIFVWSLRNEDVPELVTRIPTTAKPYEIDVNETGTTLAVAEGVTFTTYDLSDPGAPQATSTQQCPGCSQTTFARFVGEALAVYDQSRNPVDCPTGALYFYALDAGAPRLTGVYHPSQIDPDPVSPPLPRTCIVADFDVSSDGEQALLTWTDESVRLLEISDTTGAGAAVAGAGPVTEAAWFRLPGSRTWSARFGPDDTVFGIDLNVGLHVLRAP